MLSCSLFIIEFMSSSLTGVDPNYGWTFDRRVTGDHIVFKMAEFGATPFCAGLDRLLL